MTALISSTGFQSSRRILRHTFPSRFMFGWYILFLHVTFGGSCGYCVEYSRESQGKNRDNDGVEAMAILSFQLRERNAIQHLH